MKNEQAEPVGYFVNDESDDQWHQVDYEQRNGADTYPLYLHPPAAPQQAEPVAQIGWADEFGNLFPMGAWKPTQRTHHDSHKAAWRPVFLHPPADEVRRLRDAARAEVDALRADAERWRYINERNGEWRRFEADGTAPAYSMLCVRLPYDADLSCRATREIAIDAARAAQGLTNLK